MTETRLQLLGPLRISAPNQSFILMSAPLTALVGYLVLNAIRGRVVTRASTATILWPNLPEVRARRQLTETLYRLRQICDDGAPWLQSNGQKLAVDGIVTDLVEFRTRVVGRDLHDWRAAIDLYSGDVLEDLDAEWVIGDRVWFRDQYLATLARICIAIAEMGHFSDALTYADRWALADPFNEEAHRACMRLNARLGRHAVALQQYDNLVRLLEEELLTCPLPETRALANAIRAEYDDVPHQLQMPLLMERQHERMTLLRLLEQAQEGCGGIALVEGEAGIGKTRLLEAIGNGAAWRGVTVVWGKTTPYDRKSPYAPMTCALEAALAGPRAEQVRDWLPVAVLRALAPVVPSLASQPSHQCPATHGYVALLPHPDQPTADPPDDMCISEAIAVTLRALADLTPHLLLLDDLQWADVQFWRALQICAPNLVHERILLILSYRDNQLRGNADVWRVIRALDRDWALPRLSLKRLSMHASRELARSLGTALDDEGASDLHRKTDGNPLFIRELLASRTDNACATCLQDLFEQRLARCSPTARAALESAAVLGRVFNYRLWHALAGAALPSVIPRLLAERCLEEHNQGYRFRQDLFRDHIYASIVPQRRRDLHHRAAGALLNEGAPDWAAWHFAQAEKWQDAVRSYRAAGDRAAHAAAYATATAHYESALELLAHLPLCDDERQALLARRQQALSAEQHLQTQHPPSSLFTMQLARADAPLGKSLTDNERVIVHWTVDAGQADAAIQCSAGKVVLRRCRIVRLIQEAQSQGAAPTEADLAHALGVTQRTIVADIAAMRATGQMLFTRRYKTR